MDLNNQNNNIETNNQGVVNNNTLPGPNKKNKTTILITTIIIAIVLIGGAGFLYYKNKSTDNLSKQVSSSEELIVSLGADAPSSYTISGPFIISPSSYGNGIRIIASVKDSEIMKAKKEIDIRFSSVLDENGKEVLDKESSFEKDAFFTRSELEENNDPVRHYKTNRSIHAISDSSDKFSSITGTIYVDLIENEKTFSFNKSQLSALSSSDDNKIKISELEDDNLTVIINDDLNKLISVTAYDSNNNEVEKEGVSHMDNGLTIYYKISEIDKLNVVYAGNIIQKAYPFILKITTQTPSDKNNQGLGNQVISLEEKKQILKRLSYMYELFSSGNASKIRNYILSQSPESTEGIKNASDQEILSTAEMAISFFEEKPTEKLLTDPSVLWTINGDEAEVEIPYKDGSGSKTLLVKKINGAWFADE
jgi:hypothetical protein